MKVALSDYEAGRISNAVQDVAVGVRIVADGEIRAGAEASLLELLRDCDVPNLLANVTENRDGRLTWRVSRFAWALVALDWLERGGRETLGEFHLHWVQGLLYGYAPDAIESFLARLASSADAPSPQGDTAK